MRIGLISDTHLPSSIRDPWPEVALAFRQVDLILHAGDIVTPRILDWLEDIARRWPPSATTTSGWTTAGLRSPKRWTWTAGDSAMLHDVTSGIHFDTPWTL